MSIVWDGNQHVDATLAPPSTDHRSLSTMERTSARKQAVIRLFCQLSHFLLHLYCMLCRSDLSSCGLSTPVGSGVASGVATSKDLMS
jgi:hypothetical protein